MAHDAFICHASEDKAAVARPLAEALRGRNIDVWYDEFSLNVGDSLREAIDRGLESSRFAIVIVSPAFFTKPWANRELSGIVARETARSERLILPVWHNVDVAEVVSFSPPLADIRAAHSSSGIETVASALIQVIQPDDQPLPVARAELERFGWEVPPFSDEWWLDNVKLESDIAFGMFSSAFQFPPRHQSPKDGRERGENIAWAVLQSGWWDEAEKRNICQITHPDVVFDFIRDVPELYETCRADPGHLAGYVPQLLIPAFSAEFAADFDQLLVRSEEEFRSGSRSWRSPEDEGALCGATLAFRHPTLGNHRPARIVDKWLSGHKGSYRAERFPRADYLFWILSNDSAWLPPLIRNALVKGMQEWPYWWHETATEPTFKGDLRSAFFVRRRPPMKWTRVLVNDLVDSIERTRHRTGIQTPASIIADRFIEHDFVGNLGQWRRSLEERQRGKPSRL